MRRTVALLAMLACVAILATGCIAIPMPAQSSSSSGGSASQTAQQKGGTPRLAQPGKPMMPGTSQTSGAWKVTVTTTHEPAELSDGTKAPSGKKFLVVDVTLENIKGGNYLTVTPSQFSLTNASGKVIAPFPTKFSAYNAQGVRPVAAGYGGYTSFVYTVPTGDATYTFTVTPGQQGTKPMSWYVP